MNEPVSRRQVLRFSGLLSMGALLQLESCQRLFGPRPPAVAPHLEFRQLDSGCGIADDFQIQGGRGEFTFSGTVQTPDPCHDLIAELRPMRCEPSSRCPNTYGLVITSKAQEVVCVKCIGGVRYRGAVHYLTPGTYSITVAHDGRQIASEQVTVT